jgi:hypothetical protein
VRRRLRVCCAGARVLCTRPDSCACACKPQHAAHHPHARLLLHAHAHTHPTRTRAPRTRTGAPAVPHLCALAADAHHQQRAPAQPRVEARVLPHVPGAHPRDQPGARSGCGWRLAVAARSTMRSRRGRSRRRRVWQVDSRTRARAAPRPRRPPPLKNDRSWWVTAAATRSRA